MIAGGRPESPGREPWPGSSERESPGGEPWPGITGGRLSTPSLPGTVGMARGVRRGGAGGLGQVGKARRWWLRPAISPASMARTCRDRLRAPPGRRRPGGRGERRPVKMGLMRGCQPVRPPPRGPRPAGPRPAGPRPTDGLGRGDPDARLDAVAAGVPPVAAGVPPVAAGVPPVAAGALDDAVAAGAPPVGGGASPTGRGAPPVGRGASPTGRGAPPADGRRRLRK